jgi:hypothetical protein
MVCFPAAFARPISQPVLVKPSGATSIVKSSNLALISAFVPNPERTSDAVWFLPASGFPRSPHYTIGNEVTTLTEGEFLIFRCPVGPACRF